MAPTKGKKADFSVATRCFLKNPLLKRRQFVVTINHSGSWNGTVPRKKIQSKLASMYKVPDESCVFVGTVKTKFGGGSSVAIGTIYEDVAAAKRVEPVYKLRRNGMGKKKKPARKSLKERRNRAKAFRGFEKSKKLNAAKGKKK